MHPTFSIIIPTYNSAAVVQQAIQSVQQQQFSDWEILVIDGLSTDDTAQIVQSLARQDERIRIYSEKDKGIYDAMNKGMHLAKGEWFYFLGSDDRLMQPDVLQKVNEYLQSNAHDAHFVYGDVLLNSKPYNGEFDLEKLMVKNISHQGIFYNRVVKDWVGDYYLPFKAHADWDYNIRCFKDSRIKQVYIPVLVAAFAAGGISAAHDVAFLRHSLLPHKIEWHIDRGGSFNRLNAYDKWWRLLRNANIRSAKELMECSQPHAVPTPLRNMLYMQRLVPQALLRNGFISKGCMFISYIGMLIFGKRS